MAKIFISAGHFNNDPGSTSARGTREANEMIQTRDLIVNELLIRGLTVGVDFFSVPDTIDLGPTISWINSRAVAGDIALEIHGNIGGGGARGTECFFIDGNPVRQQDARRMLNALLQQVPGLTDRGPKPDTAAAVGSLGFCRQLNIASLLLELCFIDNRQDMDLLHDDRLQFAKGIVNGLIAWSGTSPRGSGTAPFTAINIKLNGRLHEDRGILVNDNSYIPLDLAGLLGIDLSSATDVRRVTQSGVVYVKAIALQPFNVSVSWNPNPPTVILNTALVAVEIDRIMGQGIASAEQLANFLQANNSGDFTTRFSNIAQLYIEEAEKEGVNPDIAFCQMCLETGYLRFGGDVSPDQNNFAGIGATGSVAGASFPDARTGAKAQTQHLKAYASTEDISAPPIVDPRFHLVNPRGEAPKVQDLSGRWAGNADYGASILSILRRLYESADIDPIHSGDSGRRSIAITSPPARSTFDLNQTFTVSGTATGSVDKVSLSTPFGGNIFHLNTAMVSSGRWNADIVFTVPGNRGIFATALGQQNNPLDFDPEELIVFIKSNFAQPVRGGYVTSSFDPARLLNGVTRPHRGTDIGHRNRVGTPILAIADGTVSFVQTGCSVGNRSCGGGFGNHVDIRHPSSEYLSRYCHLSLVNVTRDQTVTRGQEIGKMGETGRAFGPHLHIEIRRMSDNIALDPETIIVPVV